MLKTFFRRKQLALLKDYAKTKEKRQNEQRILEKFFNSNQWKLSKTIAVSFSLDFEFDTHKLIKQAKLQNKTVLLPKIVGHRKMEFVKFDTTTRLVKTKFGVLEPSHLNNVYKKSEIDTIIVPGFAFTLLGDRINFGGGFYDSYLSDYSGLSIALADNPRFFKTLAWKPDKTDIKVSKIFY